MKITTTCTLTLVYLCLICTCVSSQEAIFAFAYNKEGKTVTLDSESSEHFDYKYIIAEKVLNDLIEAKGTYNMPRPHLVMNNAEQKPAWVDLNEARIVLEEKAYDICSSLGVDSLSALSLLISHELIHYYEKHDWHNHFLKNYSDEVNGSIAEESLSLEIQADQMGGFLSKMAGFSTVGVYEKLLSRIYEDYKLDQLSDKHAYPSLKERIGLALKAEDKLEEMNLIFEMSNQLSLIGEYELASDYLDYILIKCKFQSRELHNNKGILMAFSALPYFSQQEMPYAVPFEIDIESRLNRKNIDVAKRNRYIEIAMQSFKTALLLDENYVPAQINLASLQILNGDYFEAEYLCKKSLKTLDDHSQSRQLSSVYNNLSLIYALQGQQDIADKYINQSINHYENDINTYNRNLYNNSSTHEVSQDVVQKIECSIDGVNLETLYSKIMQEEESADLAITLDKSSQFYRIKKDNSDVYVSFLDWGDMGYSFFQKGEHILIAGSKYVLGTQADKITEVLGQPDQVLNANNAKLINYKSHQVNLIVDEEGKVTEFFVYKNVN